MIKLLIIIFLLFITSHIAYTTGVVDGRIEEKERRRWKKNDNKL